MQRYSMDCDDLVEDPDGDYVEYRDAEQALSAFRWNHDMIQAPKGKSLFLNCGEGYYAIGSYVSKRLKSGARGLWFADSEGRMYRPIAFMLIPEDK